MVSLEKGENGIQIIDADFIEKVSPEAAWNVLTDYAGIPTFVTSMKSSRVLTRSGADVVVEQMAVGHFQVTKTLDILLKIKETPFSSISFEDIRLKDFDFLPRRMDAVPGNRRRSNQIRTFAESPCGTAGIHQEPGDQKECPRASRANTNRNAAQISRETTHRRDYMSSLNDEKALIMILALVIPGIVLLEADGSNATGNDNDPVHPIL